jgi:2Fe-2S ferredoxin
MARIIYVEHNGRQHEVEVADGVSLMEGALGNGVPGIDGDCGGNCACATCHVYIGAGSDGVQDNSRLACQIFAGPQLEGLVVTMPATQH